MFIKAISRLFSTINKPKLDFPMRSRFQQYYTDKEIIDKYLSKQYLLVWEDYNNNYRVMHDNNMQIARFEHFDRATLINIKDKDVLHKFLSGYSIEMQFIFAFGESKKNYFQPELNFIKNYEELREYRIKKEWYD